MPFNDLIALIEGVEDAYRKVFKEENVIAVWFTEPIIASFVQAEKPQAPLTVLTLITYVARAAGIVDHAYEDWQVNDPWNACTSTSVKKLKYTLSFNITS